MTKRRYGLLVTTHLWMISMLVAGVEDLPLAHRSRMVSWGSRSALDYLFRLWEKNTNAKIRCGGRKIYKKNQYQSGKVLLVNLEKTESCVQVADPPHQPPS